MKKITRLLLLMPLIASQCSNGDLESDCGCNSASVVKTLNDATATIHKIDPTSADKYFYIYLDEFESNAGYFSTLNSCDSLVFKNDDFQEGSRILITGEIKPTCSKSNIKLGSSPVVIKKIEVITN